jgi:hypothetical protein
VKGFLFRHVGSVGDSIGSLAVKSDAAHRRSDAITSAFAFVGISIALLGGPGWEASDDWAALCAGVVILYNTFRQLRPAVLELADIAADPGITARVKATAARVPGVPTRLLGFCFSFPRRLLLLPLCGRRHRSRGTVPQRFVRFSAHPQTMQQNR